MIDHCWSQYNWAMRYLIPTIQTTLGEKSYYLIFLSYHFICHWTQYVQAHLKWRPLKRWCGPVSLEYWCNGHWNKVALLTRHYPHTITFFLVEKGNSQDRFDTLKVPWIWKLTHIITALILKGQEPTCHLEDSIPQISGFLP